MMVNYMELDETHIARPYNLCFTPLTANKMKDEQFTQEAIWAAHRYINGDYGKGPMIEPEALSGVYPTKRGKLIITDSIPASYFLTVTLVSEMHDPRSTFPRLTYHPKFIELSAVLVKEAGKYRLTVTRSDEIREPKGTSATSPEAA